ncbi:MAG: thioredoxin family protein [Candidatus Paracaedibacteraceae bacterium]|nr:thioredoxin family protein [Candidatus Paracaedibacteraceae bacterium]
MKKLLTVVLTGCSLLTAQATQDVAKTSGITTSLKIHQMAPDFEIKDIQKKVIKLSDLKGKLVVLEWTNPGCPFVKKHYESKNMQQLQEEYTAKGVIWISVISSATGKEGYKTPDEAKAHVKTDGSHASHVILDADGKIGKAFGAKTTPHMFIINREGKIAYMGAIDDKPNAQREDVKRAHNYIAQGLDALLEGKEAVTKVTNSYGCSIKYAN